MGWGTHDGRDTHFHCKRETSIKNQTNNKKNDAHFLSLFFLKDGYPQVVDFYKHGKRKKKETSVVSWALG